MVDSQKTYCGVVIFVIFRHKGRIEANTNNAVIKNSAEMAVKELSQLSPPI